METGRRSFIPKVVIASEAKQSLGLDCDQDLFRGLIFLSFCEMLSRDQHPESVARPYPRFFPIRVPQMPTNRVKNS
jgi:hypothetical protein